MKRGYIFILLGLYFFCYTIPQYIPNVVYVYDRVAIHMLFLSCLNLVSFSILLKDYSVKQILSVFNKNYHSISYLVFIVFSLISLTVADNLSEGLVSITKFLVFFSTFVIITFLSKSKQINFFKVFVVFTLIAVFIESVFINYLFYDSVITNGNLLERSNDFKGLTANINISSFSLTLKLPLLFYLIFNTKNKYLKGLTLFMISSAILTILLLGGRASLVALFCILLLIASISVLRNFKTNLTSLSLSFLFVIISFSAYQYINQKNSSSGVIERFSVVTNPSQDDSVKERLNFYKTAIASIQNKPFLGVGVGNWKLESVKYSRDIIEEYRVPYFVHNDFLQMFAELGLFGGISYLYFIFFPFIFSLKKTLKSVNRSFSKYFLVFLIFGIYIIDSMLNFPSDRAVNVIYITFTIALFYVLNSNTVKNEK